MNDIIKRHSISPDASVREAMRYLNDLSGDSMTLFVIDDCDRVLGSVTDGDIRRILINGGSLDDSVKEVMNCNFLSASNADDISMKIAAGRKKHIELLPIIEDGKIVDLFDLRFMKASLPIEAVLMAGGRGERLRPLTDSLPKPLLPVAGKPIIDYNVEALESYGVRKIHVTLNYLGEMIRNHFRNHEGRCEINCVTEPDRLGTFGSLAYIGEVSTDNIIVMNSDLLSSINFEAMYLNHRTSGADFTIAAVPYSVSVPFAIMRMKDDRVKSLEEKPTFNYFANGGIYLFKSSLLSRIKKGEYLDAPDFITSLIADNLKVGCFHIDGTWIDIGSPDDYRLANDIASRKL